MHLISRNVRFETLVALVLVISSTRSFTLKPYTTSSRVNDFWQIGPVIKGEDLENEIIDVGEGGVRLAEESAIKVCGTVKHKPGQSDAKPMELLRYNSIKEVSENDVKDVMKQTGASILCKGFGTENYVDPGETTNKDVTFSPIEAVKAALAEAASATESDKVVLNFLGGDDLMMFEVLDATNQFVLQSDVKTQTKISFNSLCHKSIPAGTCTVTIVSMGKQKDEEAEGKIFAGAEKSVASGEIYFLDGKWWTADETDINTALS